MKRTIIIDALQRTDYGEKICIKGWVRSRRGNKNVSFIALNDGSTIKNIQIVVIPDMVNNLAQLFFHKFILCNFLMSVKCTTTRLPIFLILPVIEYHCKEWNPCQILCFMPDP